MMLFKLSWNNIKKSFKDYAIYFLTLALSVSIFYMFNSIDSQQVMLEVSRSTREIIKMMISMLGYMSVFVAVVIGLLIVYANNFLISRRKKEFGIYLYLGMTKWQISKIILLETSLIGAISLIIGLVLGIFSSQFMSIVVAKLFDADMTSYRFVFSKDAMLKTCFYFAVMYLAVILFNTFTISKYKLINLLNAGKKNEKVKMKNPVLSILVFLFASGILGYAYWIVTKRTSTLHTEKDFLLPISLGIAGTVLVFWSLSGFILNLIKAKKSTYYKGTNMFVLRQLNNKINTTVVSMSVICLMLFVTICIMSMSFAFRNTMQNEFKESVPVDINLEKTANLPDKYISYGVEVVPTQLQKDDSRKPITDTLKSNGLDMSVLTDVVEIPIYAFSDFTMGHMLGEHKEEIQKEFPFLLYDKPEQVIKLSDYNKIAELYGKEQYELNDDEFIVLCNFDNMKALRDKALAQKPTITLNGKELKSKFSQCQDGFVYMASSNTNTGIILVPDSFELADEAKERQFLAANYNCTGEKEKENIEYIFTDENSTFVKLVKSKNIILNGSTKITLLESSVGLTTIILFLGIYLGIVFLIASAAILALKQLTESSDNKQRYGILRKIGCDEKMINKALLSQIGIFFLLPLLVAVIHSVFGIKFAMIMMDGLTKTSGLIPSIIATAVVIFFIYGIYFIATYIGSKRIIKEK